MSDMYADVRGLIRLDREVEARIDDVVRASDRLEEARRELAAASSRIVGRVLDAGLNGAKFVMQVEGRDYVVDVTRTEATAVRATSVFDFDEDAPARTATIADGKAVARA